MKVRLRVKPIPLIILALVAVPLILLLSVNLYLQSSGVQERVLLSIKNAVGIPVTIQGIHATPWGGLTLSGLSVGTQGGTFLLTSERASIRPCYFKLLQGKVSIISVSADHPVILMTQAEKSEFTSSLPEIQSTLSLTPVDSSSPSSQPSTGGEKSFQKSTNETVGSLFCSLPFLRITDGSLTLLNKDNLPIASLHGVNVNGRGASANEWKGRIAIEQATVGGSLILHEIHSPVLISSSTSLISLDNITAVLGGGKLSGQFSLGLPPTAPHYNVSLHLSDAALNQLLSDASVGNAGAEGNIEGNLKLSGIAGTGSTMEGSGDILCTHAVIQPADFLKQIGQILQIDELQMLRISEGNLDFSIHQGNTLIENLTLHSDNLILTARGPIQSAGNLDLQARLLFNEKLTSRIKGFLGPQLSQAPEAGYTQVAFHVSGSVSSPRTDLLERLTGIHLGGALGGFLQGLFGRPPAH